MGSTFFSLHYHIVFSTKDRSPLIRREWRARIHSYLGGFIRNLNGVAKIAGGVRILSPGSGSLRCAAATGYYLAALRADQNAQMSQGCYCPPKGRKRIENVIG